MKDNRGAPRRGQATSTTAGPPRPASAHIDDQAAAKIPAELRDAERWIVWKHHKGKKPPFDPRGDPSKQFIDPFNPSNWMTFETATDLIHRGGVAGRGFSLGREGFDELVGVDCDHCLDEQGNIRNPNVARWVKALDSYTEITPSGDGLRVWVKGSIPLAGRRNDLAGIEIYARDRYFTVTGRHFPGTPTTINGRQEALDTIWVELWPESGPKPPSKAHGNGHASLSDDELIEKARQAKDGAKFSALFDAGDTGGNQSAADLALMNRLAFWTGRDAERMEAIFGRSALGQRPKWTERADYRKRTIDKAISGCKDVYGAPPGGRSEGVSANGDGQSEVNEGPEDPHRLARIYFEKFKSRNAPSLRFYRSAWLDWSDGAYRPVAEPELQCGLVRTIKAEFNRLNRNALKLWNENDGKDAKGNPIDKPHVRVVTRTLISNVMLALESMAMLSGKAETPAWLDVADQGQSNGPKSFGSPSNGNGNGDTR